MLLLQYCQTLKGVCLGRVNKLVAHAYLAKKPNYSGQWDDAIANADLVLAGPYRLVEDQTALSEPGYGNDENVFAINTP